MENTATSPSEKVAVPVVGPQAHRVIAKDEKLKPPVIPVSKTKVNIFVRILILFASVGLMIATCLLIAYLHIYKMFIKFKVPDPFHDSRKHPLNDPHAARG